MKCEIIIIRYGLPELEQECIDSVTAHTGDVDYRLIVHDNYEADEGLAKVWNRIISASDAEYICLLNNDTRVENQWLSKLLECFEEDERLGALGPMTNSSTGPQGSRKYRTTTKRLLKARYPLVGFCLVFPRKAWEEVGGFDEGYEIYGEDSDFIMELKERKYTVMIRTDVFIFHHGKSSTPIAIERGKDILRLKRESKERFIKKWKSGPPTDAQKEELRERDEEFRQSIERRMKARTEALRVAEENRVSSPPPLPPAPSLPPSPAQKRKSKQNAEQKLQLQLKERRERRKRYLKWKAGRKR